MDNKTRDGSQSHSTEEKKRFQVTRATIVEKNVLGT